MPSATEFLDAPVEPKKSAADFLDAAPSAESFLDAPSKTDAALQAAGVDTQPPEASYVPGEYPIAENAARAVINTVKENVPRSPGQVASLLSPIFNVPENAKESLGFMKDLFTGHAQDAVERNFPGTDVIREAEKTAPFSYERFKAGTDTLAQMLMAGGIVKGMGAPHATELQSKLFPETAKPLTEPNSDLGLPPLTEVAPEPALPSPVMPVVETGATGAASVPDAPIPMPVESLPPVQPGMVRIYHGGAAEQAGSDFTTSLQYAQGYADKSPVGGKVWYVDVPEGVVKTHDEYGQPMTRVVVPNEIADQAKPIAAAPTAEVLTPQAEVTPQGPATPEVRPQSDTTGISQAAHEARGSDVLPGEGSTPEAMIERGRTLKAEGSNPEAIASKIDSGEAISSDETSVLRAHIEDLSKEANRTQDVSDANPTDPALKEKATEAFKAESDFRQRIKPAATEWQKTGVAYQGGTDIDTGSFTGLRRAVMEEKGRDITPKEEIKLRETAKTVQDATTAEDIAKAKFNDVIKSSAKESPFKTLDDLKNHLAEKLRKMAPC